MRLSGKLRLAFAKARELGPAGLLRLVRDRRAVARSPLFDAEWYLANNPDVADARVDPVLHYILFGGIHGRSASASFVSDEYLSLNPDVRAAGANPLVHYETRGRREGRRISSIDLPLPVTYESHQASFPAKCAALAAKRAAGTSLRVAFLVTDAAMFPARPLFSAMLDASDFDPRVVVIPDLRWRDARPEDAMERCARALLDGGVPADSLSLAARGGDGGWRDELEGADLVCYPSPYELSSFRYNPRYSVGRPFLPFSVNYGFYRSLYDRKVMANQSYAWMWKAFFECEATADEYRRCSAIGGANVEVVGYVKMDPLAAELERSRAVRAGAPKRVLVALHHTVEGGANDTLALSAFMSLSDYFMELPDRFPEVEFAFRPHPYLLKILSRPGQWGEERTRDYFGRLRAKRNVRWSDGADYFRDFAESDACIQDCGSYLVEYLYTGKPCCYMLKSPGDAEAKFAPLGRECLKRCSIAYGAEDIDAFLRGTVLGGDDPKSADRAAFAKSLAVNWPHAAESALERIRAAL
ncbi:MAG: hypothetical protein J6U17_05220 [Kiritimatiellae bacterium]|nr:hypothetical protein [Kiritimatiellia bacterium]